MTSAAALRIEGVEAVAGATQIHTTFPGAGAALAAAELQQSDREVEPAILIAAGAKSLADAADRRGATKSNARATLSRMSARRIDQYVAGHATGDATGEDSNDEA